MVAEQFNIAKDELLLSLADGNDLEFNAAEYIIAWESLEKAPSDNLLKSLKNTAETIIIAKKEDIMIINYYYCSSLIIIIYYYHSHNIYGMGLLFSRP